jgi:hypothetical protein
LVLSPTLRSLFALASLPTKPFLILLSTHLNYVRCLSPKRFSQHFYFSTYYTL